MWLTLALLAACWAASILAERLTAPPGPLLSPSASALLFRLAVFTFVFLFFFSWSWRPLFAAAASLVFTGVFVAISRGKDAFVHEPLVFSDLAFIADVFRYPLLFNTGWLGSAFLAGAIALILALIAGWWQFEPMLPVAGLDWALLAAPALGWLLLLAMPFLPVLRRYPERWALSIKRDAAPDRDLRCYGQLAALVLDWLGWRGDDRGARLAADHPRAGGGMVPAKPRRHADLLVVIQIESFCDFRRFPGGDVALPGLDRARARSSAWGMLRGAFPGGYTMRTEFSFLTGLAPAALAFDRYYPYLNAAPYRPAALPERLARRGYHSQFIHPYEPGFFWRHHGVPALGFHRLVMQDAFAGAPLVGSYVSDRAVGERVLAEAGSAGGPAFLFAATMENHGPWEASRFPGLSDPIAVYKRQLQNADAMIALVMDGLDAWPGRAVLAVYGDHVPLLKAYADPFPDSRTDYVLLELGEAAPKARAPVQAELEIEELSARFLTLAGLDGAE